MAPKRACSVLLLLPLLALATVQAQLPSAASKLSGFGKTASDMLKGVQGPLLNGPPSINVYNNGTFGQSWFDASRGGIKCDFTSEEPHGSSNLTAAVHVAPWGEFALSTGGTPFGHNGVLDFWAKGSGLALVSILLEDRANRRWSSDVRLSHGANTTGLTLSDYDSDDWMRVQLDLDKLTDGTWLTSVTDPGWDSIVFRDISGMGFFMRLDKVQLVYSTGLLNFGASSWDPLLAPATTLSPLYNQDFPGKLANPNRYIMRLRSTVSSPFSQMTDICSELKGALNAAGVPQRFRGACVSPAASWKFLTVEVDGNDDLLAMRTHLSDKVAYFEQDLTAFALPMRSLRIHEMDSDEQGDQPAFNQAESSQILGSEQVTQEEQADFPGNQDQSPAPNTTVNSPPSTTAGNDTIKIVVQPSQLGNSTNSTTTNVTHGTGDDGTVTVQGAVDEEPKYTTQVEDPELDAAETASIQSAASSWGLDRIDQVNLPLNSDYNPGLDGRATHVYVLDTGVRTSHNNFRGRIGEGASLVSSSVWDDNGHGSHVAGIAAGAIHGVANSAIIHPVKVLKGDGSGSFSTIIEGMRWVREHKTKNRYTSAVAVMSLGGPRSASLNDAVEDLSRAGVSVVVAAGNNRGADSCTMSPASAPSAITVGSSTNEDKISSFSNIGRCLSLFAPGSQIVSASYKSDTGSATMSGTSMAAPHVAGAAALYMQVRPGAAPSEVKAALQKASVGKFFESSSPQRLLNVMASRLRSAAPGGGSAPAPSTTQSRPAPTPAAAPKAAAPKAPATSSRPSYCTSCPWCMFCS